MTCCRQFCSEFKRPMYSVNDSKGTLDINETFHIGRGILSWVGVLKTITFAISIAVLVYAFYKHPAPSFYPSYLTPWGVVFCIMYLGGSFWLTVFGFPDNSNREQATKLVKFTWMFYSIAAVLGCCIAVLYWGFVWYPDRGIELNNVMTHGGALCIVLLQGLVVDRVPLRFKHNFTWGTAIALIYLGWLAIHGLVVKYNPVKDEGEGALYNSVDFDKNPTGALILAGIVVFGAIPLFTTLLWLLSLPGRRYLDEKPMQEEEDYGYGEEGAV